MTRISLVRLPDKTGEEVQKYAQERGLAFATAVRCIVVEHLKENCVRNGGKACNGRTRRPEEEDLTLV